MIPVFSLHNISYTFRVAFANAVGFGEYVSLKVLTPPIRTCVIPKVAVYPLPQVALRMPCGGPGVGTCNTYSGKCGCEEGFDDAAAGCNLYHSNRTVALLIQGSSLQAFPSFFADVMGVTVARISIHQYSSQHYTLDIQQRRDLGLDTTSKVALVVAVVKEEIGGSQRIMPARSSSELVAEFWSRVAVRTEGDGYE